LDKTVTVLDGFMYGVPSFGVCAKHGLGSREQHRDVAVLQKAQCLVDARMTEREVTRTRVTVNSGLGDVRYDIPAKSVSISLATLVELGHARRFDVRYP
jgi:hypothetical protein